MWTFLKHGQFRELSFYSFLTTISLINRFFMKIEDIFIPQLKKTPLDNVVFILGHPRSGTTNLQKSLKQHPSCIAGDMFDLIFPSLILKKIMHHKIMHPIRDYFDSLIVNYSTKNHAFNINEEIEEHFWLLHHSIIYELAIIFPTLFIDCPEIFENASHFKEDDFEFIKACIQRIVFEQNREQKKIYIAKPLFFTKDYALLKRHFPQAKFVVSVRNPIKAISSHIALLSTILNFDANNPQLNVMARYYYHSFSIPYYQEMLHMTTLNRNEHSLFFIKFENLIKTPSETLKHIQHYLGLPILNLNFIRSERHGKTNKHNKVISNDTIERDLGNTYKKIISSKALLCIK